MTDKKLVTCIDFRELNSTIGDLITRLSSYDKECVLETYFGYGNIGLYVYKLEEYNE